MDVSVAVNQELISEIKRLRGRVETMERALKVIHTWAATDRAGRNGGRVALLPVHVEKLAAEALGYGEKAR